MDDVLHKLHCLNYEREYCEMKDVQPFHRVYFALPSPHSGLQFSHFVSLAQYLLGQSRRPFAVDKMEDPASLLSRLVAEARALGLTEDIQPLRLRTAHGEAVVRLLNFLCDRALEARGWRFERPNYGGGAGGGGADGDAEAVEEEDGVGGGGGDGEDEVVVEGQDDDADEITEKDAVGAPDDDDDDDDAGIATIAGSAGGSGPGAGGAGAAGASTSAGAAGTGSSGGPRPGILEAAVDPAQWKLEVERAGAKIRAPALAAAGREWRSHLEQTNAAEAAIARMLPDTQGSLDRLAASLSEALTGISGKERFLQASCKSLAAEYRATATALDEVNGAYTAASNRVGGMSSELNALGEALEELRTAMEEKGSSMTDTSPLIRVKAALSALRAEIKTFDLHLGVLGHAVMQSKVQHKVAARGGSAGGSGSGGGSGGGSGSGGGLNSSFSKAGLDVSSGSDPDDDDDDGGA